MVNTERARTLVGSIPEGGFLRSENGSLRVEPLGGGVYRWTVGKGNASEVDEKKVVDRLRRFEPGRFALIRAYGPDQEAEADEQGSARDEEMREKLGIKKATANPDKKRRSREPRGTPRERKERAERFDVTPMRGVRKAAEKSMKEVATPAGLSGAYVSNLERGKYRATREQVEALAASLGVEPERILATAG